MKSETTFFTVPAAALVQALWARASAVGHVHTGTYNEADPTAYASLSVYLYVEIDPWLMKNYKHAPTAEELREYPEWMFTNASPPDADYLLEMRNGTWGTEVSLTFRNSSVDDDRQAAYAHGCRNKVFNFYISHDNGKIDWAHIQDNLFPWLVDTELSAVLDFLLTCICGDVEFSTKPHKFTKEISKSELVQREIEQEWAAADAALLRSGA